MLAAVLCVATCVISTTRPIHAVDQYAAVPPTSHQHGAHATIDVDEWLPGGRVLRRFVVVIAPELSNVEAAIVLGHVRMRVLQDAAVGMSMGQLGPEVHSEVGVGRVRGVIASMTPAAATSLRLHPDIASVVEDKSGTCELHSSGSMGDAAPSSAANVDKLDSSWALNDLCAGVHSVGHKLRQPTKTAGGAVT